MNWVIAFIAAGIAFFIINSKKKDNGNNANEKIINNITNKTKPSQEVAFLNENYEFDNIDNKAVTIHELVNMSSGLYGQHDYKGAIRCMNKALAMNPSCEEAIVCHRNRAVALSTYLDFGNPNKTKNFDWCYAAEHLLRDTKAIIGLYATNEPQLAESSSADFLRDSFNMALSNYNPVGMAIMAYTEKGTAHFYDKQLQDEWKIAFVADPKNALSVNGTIYPQHRLAK